MSLTHCADLKHEGLYRRRISDSPREKAIAEQWDKENADGVPFGPHWSAQRVPLIVSLLMGEKDSPEVTQRDAIVAATVLQWLGSNVGFCFLQEAFNRAGYEIKQRGRQSGLVVDPNPETVDAALDALAAQQTGPERDELTELAASIRLHVKTLRSLLLIGVARMDEIREAVISEVPR